MKNYKISANFIRVIRNLYDKATSAVLFNRSIGLLDSLILVFMLMLLDYHVFLVLQTLG